MLRGDPGELHRGDRAVGFAAVGVVLQAPVMDGDCCLPVDAMDKACGGALLTTEAPVLGGGCCLPEDATDKAGGALLTTESPFLAD